MRPTIQAGSSKSKHVQASACKFKQPSLQCRFPPQGRMLSRAAAGAEGARQGVPVFGPKSRACGACSFRPPPRAVGVPEVQQNYGADGRVPRRWGGVGVLVGSAPGNFTAKLATLGLIWGAAAFGRRPRGPESTSKPRSLTCTCVYLLEHA